VFLRIRPGVNEATVVRPMNATAGEPLTKLTKFNRHELLEIIRVWREQTASCDESTVSAELAEAHQHA
jgi:hypothetical protein